MKECPHCARTFLEEKLSIHLNSCTVERPHKTVRQNMTPTFNRKTAQFMSNQLRTSAVLLPEQRAASSYDNSSADSTRAKVPVFIRCDECGEEVPEMFSLLHAKNHEGTRKTEDRKDRPHTPVSVRCPHCTRNFDRKVADRHIPKCAEIVNRPKPPIGTIKQPLLETIKKPSSEYIQRSSKPIKYPTIEDIRQSPIESLQLPQAKPAKQPTETANNIVVQEQDAQVMERKVKTFCHLCGEKFLQDAKFCAYCGTKK